MGDRIEREAVIESIKSVLSDRTDASRREKVLYTPRYLSIIEDALVEAIKNIPGDRPGVPFEIAEMYFCPSCKYATAKVYKYCGYCGLKFDWSEPNAGENGV